MELEFHPSRSFTVFLILDNENAVFHDAIETWCLSILCFKMSIHRTSGPLLKMSPSTEDNDGLWHEGNKTYGQEYAPLGVVCNHILAEASRLRGRGVLPQRGSHSATPAVAALVLCLIHAIQESIASSSTSGRVSIDLAVLVVGYHVKHRRLHSSSSYSFMEASRHF